jgi:hypothetical protein
VIDGDGDRNVVIDDGDDGGTGFRVCSSGTDVDCLVGKVEGIPRLAKEASLYLSSCGISLALRFPMLAGCTVWCVASEKVLALLGGGEAGRGDRQGYIIFGVPYPTGGGGLLLRGVLPPLYPGLPLVPNMTVT